MITNKQVRAKAKEATKIIESPEGIERLEVVIKSNYESVWVGGTEEVTNRNGFILKPFETFKVTLSPSNTLYLYAIKSTIVHVLSTEF